MQTSKAMPAKLLLSVLCLLCLLSYSQALSTGDFLYSLPLSFTPSRDIPAPFTGFVEVNSSESFWPEDENCLAVAWQNQILPRKIQPFQASQAIIYFPVQEAMTAGQTNSDYRLLAGCAEGTVEASNYLMYETVIDDFADNEFESRWEEFSHHVISSKDIGRGEFVFKGSAAEQNSSLHSSASLTWIFAIGHGWHGLRSRQPLFLEPESLLKIDFSRSLRLGRCCGSASNTITLSDSQGHNLNLVQAASEESQEEDRKITVYSEDLTDFNLSRLTLTLKNTVNANGASDVASASASISLHHLSKVVAIKASYPSTGGSFQKGWDLLSPYLAESNLQGTLSANQLHFVLKNAADLDRNSISVDLNGTASTDFNAFGDCQAVNQTDLNCFYQESGLPEGQNQITLHFSDLNETKEFTFNKLPEISSTELDQNILHHSNIAFMVTDSWPGGIKQESIQLMVDGNQSDFNAWNGCSVIENGFNCQADLNLTFGQSHAVEISCSSLLDQNNARTFEVFLEALPEVEEEPLPVVEVAAPPKPKPAPAPVSSGGGGGGSIGGSAFRRPVPKKETAPEPVEENVQVLEALPLENKSEESSPLPEEAKPVGESETASEKMQQMQPIKPAAKKVELEKPAQAAQQPNVFTALASVFSSELAQAFSPLILFILALLSGLYIFKKKFSAPEEKPRPRKIPKYA